LQSHISCRVNRQISHNFKWWQYKYPTIEGQLIFILLHKLTCYVVVCIVATHKYFATALVGLIDPNCHLVLLLGYQTVVTMFHVSGPGYCYCGVGRFDSCMNSRCRVDCYSNTAFLCSCIRAS